MRNDHKKAIELCKKKGHSIIHGFCDEAEVVKLRNEVELIQNNWDEYKSVMHFIEEKPSGEKNLIRAERIWESIPSLCEGDVGKRLFNIARGYIGEEAVLFKDKVNIRLAGSKGFAPHQDSASDWYSYGNNFLSIGIFLNQSTPYKGGFEVVDNKHLIGPIDNIEGRIELEEFRKLEPYGISAEAGDVILLDGDAPHRTLDNNSKEDTSHLILSYFNAEKCSAREDYYSKKTIDFDGDTHRNIYIFRSVHLDLNN